MRRLANWITENYSNSILDVITMPAIDPAVLVGFQQIANANTKHFRCTACGSRHQALSRTSFCITCLTSLYVIPRS